MKFLQIWVSLSSVFFLPAVSHNPLLKVDGNISGVLSITSIFNAPYFDNNNNYDFSNATMAQVDAEADLYTPPNKVYTYDEAIKLRKHLDNLVNTNKKSIGLYWAMLRYYSGAADFVGGTSGSAFLYANYIYSLNPYIGCLAYEFAYSKLKDLTKAHEWYDRSLSISLPNSMIWEEIKYNNTVQSSIKVTGNFNNWKLQNMYETKGGTYNRKIMMPKCENCEYKILVDYRTIHPPSSTRESLIFNN